MTPTSPRALAPLCALVLLAAPLAGCLGSSDSESGSRFASYDEARSAVGETFEPANASSPIRLGLIQPEDPERIGQGSLEVVVLLFDAEADEPITDAKFVINAYMPAMGHGTDPETNPSHDAHGVYVGSTTISMGGTWKLNLDPTLSDGTTLEFDVTTKAEGGDGGMDHGDHGHHGGHGANASTSYESYEDAKAAEGPVLEPREDDAHRLKLLEPVPRTNVSVGTHNVTVLVFDSEADEPVTEGNATLNATMPATGHGASPESDPVHAAHGVWKGETTFSMNGTWILNVDVRPANGSWLHWDVNVTVGNASDDEPAFEPYTEVFDANVSSADYSQTHTFPVEAANASVTMNATLEDASPLDDLTATLLDPDGSELGSVTLDAQSSSAQLEVEAPAAGDYDIEVSGQAVESRYVIEAHVAPPG